jgi:hypothetical protein
MAPTLSFDRLRSILVATVTHLPDYRKRRDTVYEIADAALGAFAVFFMQSASFLAHQRDLQRTQGQNNAQSLFGIDQVPSDPQIRNLLDPIAPEYLAACQATIRNAHRIASPDNHTIARFVASSKILPLNDRLQRMRQYVFENT